MSEKEKKYPIILLGIDGRYRLFETENKFINFDNTRVFKEYIEKNKEKINIGIFDNI